MQPQKIATLRSLQAEIVTLEHATDVFLTTALVGLAPGTIGWYGEKLRSLTRHFGPDHPLVHIESVDLIDWLTQLSNQKIKYASGKSSRPPVSGSLSAHTLHGHVRAAKRFFGWLQANQVRDDNPADVLRRPKLPVSAKRGIADKDAALILAAARSNVRDFAIIKFLETTGARRGGLVNLTLDRLTLTASPPNNRRVFITEKGSKERYVFLTPGAFSALQSWLFYRTRREATGEIPPNIPQVFLGKSNGKPWTAITGDGIYQILERYANAQGVKSDWSPHNWRHRLARRLLQNGRMSLAEVSQLLGHSSVDVTVRHYGQFAVNQLQASFDAVMDLVEL